MGNCSNCGCNDLGEMKTNEVQYDDRQRNSAKTQGNTPSLSGTANAAQSNGDQMPDLKLFRAHVRVITKLQALWRGHSTRQQVALIRKVKRADSRYFTMEEQKETISNAIYNPNAQREDRPLYTFRTGATYLGQWIGGFRDGFGKQMWPDGACYEGFWKDNRAHGQGKFIHIDGDIYEGNWVNDKANGYGVYIHVNGARYEGHWKDDLQHGMGKESWTDGSLYEGEYMAGKKHGRGVYSWNDCSRYDGEWQENKIKGLGTYTWLDGREYRGEWVDNNMDGIGVYTWQDGRKYEGEYKDDKKQGYGVYTWSDGRQYQGYWWRGKQHGLGCYSVPGQVIKFGLWEEGKRIEWFDEETQALIKYGKSDYKSYFRKQESGFNVDPLASFDTPEQFYFQVQQIAQKFSA